MGWYTYSSSSSVFCRPPLAYRPVGVVLTCSRAFPRLLPQSVRGRLLVLPAGVTVRGLTVRQRPVAFRGRLRLCSVPAATILERRMLAALHRHGELSHELTMSPDVGW